MPPCVLAAHDSLLPRAPGRAHECKTLTGALLGNVASKLSKDVERPLVVVPQPGASLKASCRQARCAEADGVSRSRGAGGSGPGRPRWKPCAKSTP